MEENVGESIRDSIGEGLSRDREEAEFRRFLKILGVHFDGGRFYVGLYGQHSSATGTHQIKVVYFERNFLSSFLLSLYRNIIGRSPR